MPGLTDVTFWNDRQNKPTQFFFVIFSGIIIATGVLVMLLRRLDVGQVGCEMRLIINKSTSSNVNKKMLNYFKIAKFLPSSFL